MAQKSVNEFIDYRLKNYRLNSKIYSGHEHLTNRITV